MKEKQPKDKRRDNVPFLTHNLQVWTSWLNFILFSFNLSISSAALLQCKFYVTISDWDEWLKSDHDILPPTISVFIEQVD